MNEEYARKFAEFLAEQASTQGSCQIVVVRIFKTIELDNPISNVIYVAELGCQFHGHSIEIELNDHELWGNLPD